MEGSSYGLYRARTMVVSGYEDEASTSHVEFCTKKIVTKSSYRKRSANDLWSRVF